MALIWNKYVMDGKVVTESGVEFNLSTDSGSSDYSVITMSQPEAKITKQDLKEIVQLLSREGFTTLGVK
jgi:hypothetical protein